MNKFDEARTSSSPDQEESFFLKGSFQLKKMKKFSEKKNQPGKCSSQIVPKIASCLVRDVDVHPLDVDGSMAGRRMSLNQFVMK